MRQRWIVLISVLAIQQFMLCTSLFAQPRKVRVPPGFGTLNEAIRNDTLPNGQRRDPNTVYVLKRGGVYVLSGTLLATDFDLNIEAEEGAGPRPFIIMGFLTGAAQVEESIKIFSNLNMKSVFMTNINEFNTYIARMIAVDAPNARLNFYDCLFDGSGQTFIRLNSGGAKIYMRNCTVSRMGRPSNPDNGRVIDDRGNTIDSLVVENNTWYNVTSRIVRDGGGEINYVRMNQNTFVNVGQRLAAIGPVNQFIFTNNLVVNPRFIGNSPTSTLVSLEFQEFGSSPLIVLDYNNIFYSQDVLDVWDEISSQQTTPIVPPPFVAPVNQHYMNNAIGIINEQITFQSGPASPIEILRVSNLGTGSTVPDWDWTGAIPVNPWQLNANAYHHFGYSNTSVSFTGSSTNEPLGDLRWFTGYEISWNLAELIKEAQKSIMWYENNPVIEINPLALSDLQSAISAAAAVANDPGSTRAETFTQYQALSNALQLFKNGLTITGITESSGTLSKVYPNPFDEFLMVDNSERKISGIIIYDLTGKMAYQKNIDAGLHRLDLNWLPSGFYLIKCIGQNSAWFTFKILKR